MTKRRDGGSPVRRVLGVRDGDATDARIGQHGQATTHVDAGVGSRPEHEAAGCVLVQAAAFGLARTFEAPRIVDIRREKDVEGGAVLDLREEVS